MLERFSVTVAAATILAVLGKVALLYHTDKEAGKDWFAGPADQTIISYLLLAVFLVFFRGKMMHDDATYFEDLTRGDVFKSGKRWRFLIKLGLLLGYLSWLLWAPAIYFLEDRGRFAGFLIVSLLLSSCWLIVDIATRKEREWRRLVWLLPNALYIGCLILLLHPGWVSFAAIALLAVLAADWLVTDPMSGHI